MNVTLRIRRFDPEKGKDAWDQDFAVDVEPGDAVLTALLRVHDFQDGGLAVRYSCRGAICGSCAMKINGTAMLACKTQVTALATAEHPVIEVAPMTNLGVLKDLVVQQDAFWAAIDRFLPWLHRPGDDAWDPVLKYGEAMSPRHFDQLDRCATCIRCGCCTSDCPKVGHAGIDGFIGPAACVALYRFLYDPRNACEEQERMARDAAGPNACDNHGTCVKVCPKDVRPQRAINMTRQDRKA
jgi:succinate dehydrogenase / fumarate reductase iron-sulfur subunit